MTLQRSDVTVSKTGYEHRVVFIKKTGKVIGEMTKDWGDYPSHTGWEAQSYAGLRKFHAYQKDAVRWIIQEWQTWIESQEKGIEIEL